MENDDMKPNRTFLAFAIAVLISLMLACDASTFGLGVTGTATPSGPPRVYLASDKAGSHETDSFSSSDTVYALVDARGLPPGVQFDFKWYAVEVPTIDPKTEVAYHTVSHDGTSPIVEAWVDGLPAGQFRVDVYENGAKIAEKIFNVQ
jgi:hypothetical protein